MTNVNYALEQARKDAHTLRKSIAETTGKDHAAIRAKLVAAGAAAQELEFSLKSLSQTQEADQKQHLQDAANALQAAAQSVKSVAKAGDADLKAANATVLARVSNAVKSLSEAVAEKRSAAKLAKV